MHCPRCSSIIYVVSIGNLQDRGVAGETKVTCRHCGYNRILAGKPMDIAKLSHGKFIKVRHSFMNSPIDPFSQLPLWLQKELSGNTTTNIPICSRSTSLRN